MYMLYGCNGQRDDAAVANHDNMSLNKQRLVHLQHQLTMFVVIHPSHEGGIKACYPFSVRLSLYYCYYDVLLLLLFRFVV